MAPPRFFGEATLDTLPGEIVSMIMLKVDSIDYLSCRLVSKNMKARLDDYQLCREMLRINFPIMPWGRLLEKKKQAAMDDEYFADDDSVMSDDPFAVDLENQNWTRHLLDTIRRQLAIETQTYSRSFTISGHKNAIAYLPVVPWGVNGLRQHFEKHADPAWVYCPDTSVLVYFHPYRGCFVGRHLDTNRRADIPFKTRGRIIRRLRMNNGILAIEWALMKSRYTLTGDHYHLHWVTLFDCQIDFTAEPPEFSFMWRFVWNIKDEGFLIEASGANGETDVFLSAHNENHYAIYMYVVERLDVHPFYETNESVIVWDIRPAPGKEYPVICKMLGDSSVSITSFMPPEDMGHPTLQGFFLDPDSLDPDEGSDEGCLCGHVFLHYEKEGPRIPDPDHAYPPHWRIRDYVDPKDGVERELKMSNVIRRMHDSEAGLALAVVYVMSTQGVRVTSVFGRVSEEHISQSGNSSYLTSWKARRYAFDSARRDCKQLRLDPSVRPSFKFCGRFFIAGDNKRIIGENSDGDIDVFTL
ncbi:hypothetical protein F5X68DRAFT_241496 [Plectosphaerella plurivora]|uniref:F-box domain-containing protein n=1 Tax=Plectosphaerella plurivora TaxID=936078 RepID=A0A9P8V9H4_9PEZI|nr:hypothetical protein F5X68DRAFT_241496 [Plectosphaerella plurivora]